MKLWRKHIGFSLIEILMTLSLCAIIAAITVPIYSQHVTNTRRLEAASLLSQLAVALQQYQIEHNSYRGATLEDLKFPETIAKKQYKLAIEEMNGNYFMLAAKPQGKQAQNDWECGELLLDSDGKKSISGSGAISHCW